MASASTESPATAAAVASPAKVAAAPIPIEEQRRRDEAAMKQAMEAKEAGNKKFSAGAYREAIPFYSRAIALGPEQTWAAPMYGNRSACMLMLGLLSDASRDVTKALSMDPSLVKCWQRAAKIHILLGNADAAVDAANRAVALLPNDADAKELVSTAESLRTDLAAGAAALAAGSWRAAQAALERAETKAKNSNKITVDLCRVYIAQKNWSAAMRSTLQVIRLDDNVTDAWFLRGQAFYYTENYEQAIKHYQECLRKDPDHSGAAAELKRVRSIDRAMKACREAVFVRKFEESLPLFTDAMALIDVSNAPLIAKLQSERAEALYRLNRYDEALKDATASIYLYGGHVTAYLTRSLIYKALARFENAMNDLETILRDLDQTNALAHERLEAIKFEVRRQKRPDYYAILGVPSVASLTEIKVGYKKVALDTHPDRATPENKEKAETAFKLVAEAFEVLSDPAMKELYDSGHDLEAIREKIAQAAHKRQRGAGGHGHGGHGGGGGDHGHSHGGGGDHGHSHGN